MNKNAVRLRNTRIQKQSLDTILRWPKFGPTGKEISSNSRRFGPVLKCDRCPFCCALFCVEIICCAIPVEH